MTINSARGWALRSLPVVLSLLAGFAAAQAAETRTPFQQSLINRTCKAGQTCAVAFRSVPTASRLEINNASCHVEIGSDFPGRADCPAPVLRQIQLRVLNSTGSLSTTANLVPTNVIASASRPVFTTNQAVSLFANAGQRFQAVVIMSSECDKVLLLACHIGGQMVTLR